MSPLDQSGVTVGGLDPYNMHALFVNMDNMWTERFGNYDCLVLQLKTDHTGEVLVTDDLGGPSNQFGLFSQ